MMTIQKSRVSSYMVMERSWLRHSRHLTRIIVAIRLDHYEALASIQTHNLVSSSKNFILYVSDQNASRQFYQEILDLQPALDVPGMTEFLIGEDC